MSFIAISRLSPSTKAKERFTHPGEEGRMKGRKGGTEGGWKEKNSMVEEGSNKNFCRTKKHFHFPLQWG